MIKHLSLVPCMHRYSNPLSSVSIGMVCNTPDSKLLHFMYWIMYMYTNLRDSLILSVLTGRKGKLAKFTVTTFSPNIYQLGTVV